MTALFVFLDTRQETRAIKGSSSKGIGSGYSLPKRGEKGHELYTGIGADLMKYYSRNKNIPFSLNYYKSIEYDLKSLVWLSKLFLGGKK